MNARDLTEALTESLHPVILFETLVGRDPSIWALPWSRKPHVIVYHGMPETIPRFELGWQHVADAPAPYAYLNAMRAQLDHRAIGIISTARVNDSEHALAILVSDFWTRAATCTLLSADGTTVDDDANGPLADALGLLFSHRYS